MKPQIFDLFCKQGGAGKGYADAGFDVVGVDHDDQPRYPFDFIFADAIDVLKELVEFGRVLPWTFDAVHASPPCQLWTKAQKIRRNDHPDLIGPTRELLTATGLPYVIENVPGAPLLDPFELCGCMFGLGTYRPRIFETNFPVSVPEHRPHTARNTKMGRKPQPGEFMHVVGNFSGVAQAKAAMGIDWMTRDGLREAIPPAYTHYIGVQLAAHLRAAA